MKSLIFALTLISSFAHAEVTFKATAYKGSGSEVLKDVVSTTNYVEAAEVPRETVDQTIKFVLLPSEIGTYLPQSTMKHISNLVLVLDLSEAHVTGGKQLPGYVHIQFEGKDREEQRSADFNAFCKKSGTDLDCSASDGKTNYNFSLN